MNLWVKVARLLESLEQMEREFEPLFSPAETEEEIRGMDPALKELRGLQADIKGLRYSECLSKEDTKKLQDKQLELTTKLEQVFEKQRMEWLEHFA